MTEYAIGKISPNDKKSLARIEQLLEQEGIRRDPHLDYVCAVFNQESDIIATGSCFGNTLRCLAVAKEHQGKGLMNRIITHLINIQMERGHSHLFLYTKADSAKFFQDLGFYEITQIPRQIAFMENRRNGFQHYLKRLQSAVNISSNLKIAALVMNCNPFTLGHQFLIEKAAQENDIVHVFIVSEEQSLFPFNTRKALVIKGTAHLPNVICHESGSYIISQNTFPSYFQESEDAVIESNAKIDLQIFIQIAKALGIKRRYVGSEPFSRVTHIYNQIMQTTLPEKDIECIEVERRTIDGQIISASKVRQAIKLKDFERVKQLVPATTYQFLTSDEAKTIIQNIQNTENVVHY
ncbi:[citrate (pro-3S)-lyase] ligase [Rodentibacter caecimuris]|uniref:[Citrate [pro-3S]-lyase] ligase n=1 Tax=Rodentibacter caecimuris TaxID=1796644 RepID=A0ABX3KYM8_9PAST|nr:[citrate (pro-3S)-lyase] ligase [Rodentibacter heylii]